jgi:hypothetical protein
LGNNKKQEERKKQRRVEIRRKVMKNEELIRKKIDIWMEEREEDEEKEELELIIEEMIRIAEEELLDCATKDKTWDLIEDKFMEGRLRAMKKWLEEIKKRFKQGRIDEEEEMRKLEMKRQKEEGKEVRIIQVNREEKEEEKKKKEEQKIEERRKGI